MARVDYDRQARRYQAGRGVPMATLAPWRTHLAPYLARGGEAPVLDVGAGTGIWTRALVAWFDGSVIAVEPSAGMRTEGVRVGLPPGAGYVAATAEALPLGDGTGRAAWLSTVVHHLDDVAACARELRRVLTPGGAVLVRSSFPGRQEEVGLLRYFTAALAVTATWPRLDDVVRDFADAGFPRSHVTRVREGRWSDLSALRAWALSMRHTDSTLRPLSDAEFGEGVARLDQAMAAGDEPPPLGLDLVVMR